MSDTSGSSPLRGILGSDDRDPGCDAAFEVFDEYCEAVARGEDVSARFASFVTHIRNCAACREDVDGLMAALGAPKGGSDPR